jgi:hypothetical protein
MKKPLGMKNAATVRSMQAATFGPHHLFRTSIDQYCCRGEKISSENEPILNRGALSTSVLDADEEAGEDSVEEGEGEADAVDLEGSAVQIEEVRRWRVSRKGTRGMEQEDR